MSARGSVRLRQVSAAAVLLVLLGSGPLAANPFYGDAGGKVPAAPLVTPGPFGGLLGVQAQIKDGLADAFGRFSRSASPGAWLAVLGIAFVYGILHAAGPGHRKTVVFSLFLGRNAHPWEPAAAGFLSAGIHAASGGLILLVLSVLRGVLVSYSHTDALITWMDGITLCVLVLLSLGLIVNALGRAIRGTAHSHPGPDAGEAGLYSILVLASIVPCPGAIMVLMFALYMKAVLLGVAAFLAMSLGMGIVVSAAAYLAWFGRTGLFSSLKDHGTLIARISASLETLSYLIILGFALHTAWPFIVSLFA